MAIFSISPKAWAGLILWFILAPVASRWGLGPLYVSNIFSELFYSANCTSTFKANDVVQQGKAKTHWWMFHASKCFSLTAFYGLIYYAGTWDWFCNYTSKSWPAATWWNEVDALVILSFSILYHKDPLFYFIFFFATHHIQRAYNSSLVLYDSAWFCFIFLFQLKPMLNVWDLNLWG